MKDKLVYIASADRSGSTLLDLLLGAHSQAVSVGEFHRLPLFIRLGMECTCGAPIPDCGFWRSVAETAAARRGWPDPMAALADFGMMLDEPRLGGAARALETLALSTPGPWLSGLVSARHAAVVRDSAFILDCVRAAAGRPVVVESTKDARRFRAYQLAADQNLYVVRLVRDGRAVAASAMRRENATMDHAARDWSRKNRNLAVAAAAMPRDRVIMVRYEDLCADLEGQIRRLCDFLDLAFEPAMLRLGKRNNHNVSGNEMRHRYGETDIKLDERWKTQLTKADLDTFERLAGRRNRALGYA